MRQAISNFFGSLLAPGDAIAQQPALELAAAVLLYEVAKADFAVDQNELTTLQHSLASVLQLDTAQAAKVMAEAAALSDSAIALHPFTRTINDSLGPNERQQILTALWQVAYADGSIDKYEEHYLRKVADLLYIPHSGFIQAKLAAQQAASSG